MADEDLENSIPDANSLRDSVTEDVRAAFKQHSEPDVAEALTNSTDETPAERTERLRDEKNGRFVAKDKVEPQTAAPDKFTDADRPAEQPVQQSNAAGPPTSWSADEKAMFATLPPAIQAAVSRREAQMNEGARQWSEQRQTYERDIAPVAAVAQEYNMPVGDAIARLVAVERRLMTPEAPQVIAEMAKAYGVDLVALVNGSQQPRSANPQTFDPNQIPLIVQRQINEALQKQETERQQADAVKSTLNDFANEKDAAGNIAHPHFSDAKVKVLMGKLMTAGEASDTQEAYDKAIWAIPDIRSKLIAAQTAAASPDRARVDKAKRAAVSLNGSPRGAAPSNRSVNGSGTVLDDVRAAFEEHAGRA